MFLSIFILLLIFPLFDQTTKTHHVLAKFAKYLAIYAMTCLIFLQGLGNVSNRENASGWDDF